MAHYQPLGSPNGYGGIVPGGSPPGAYPYRAAGGVASPIGSAGGYPGTYQPPVQQGGVLGAPQPQPQHPLRAPGAFPQGSVVGGSPITPSAAPGGAGYGVVSPITGAAPGGGYPANGHAPPQQPPRKPSSQTPSQGHGQNPNPYIDSGRRPTIDPNMIKSMKGTAEGASLERRVQVLNRVGKMLRRKVGHEREDKAYDSLMRAKTLHITIFSMLGVITMIVGGCLTWYTGDFRSDTHWKNANPTMKTVMLSMQIVLTLSTLVTMFLIVQYYRMLLLSKRSEWSMASEHDDINPESYSFWKSTSLRGGFLAEILVHIIHPVFWMQDFSYSIFTLCQIFMFFRLYLFVRILHTFSRPYRLRIEIINSNRDFQTMNLRIKMNLTLKMLFYNRTYTVLAVSFFASITVFSIMIFLVERNEQRNAFGRLENVFWFAFITFTTIGFGDFAPATIPGRAITVMLGVTGVIVTTVFSGVLTNKLAPTKIQRYVVEYLQVREATDNYRQCAAKLLQAAFHDMLVRRKGARRVRGGHKSNAVYGAIKEFRRARYAVRGAVLPSTDPVLEDKMVSLKQYLRSLEAKLATQQDMMRELQDKIDYELASILRLLAR